MPDTESGLPVGLKSDGTDQTPEDLQNVAYCILQGISCLLTHRHAVDAQLDKAAPDTPMYELYTFLKSLCEHGRQHRAEMDLHNTMELPNRPTAEKLAMPVNMGLWMASLGLLRSIIDINHDDRGQDHHTASRHACSPSTALPFPRTQQPCLISRMNRFPTGL